MPTGNYKIMRILYLLTQDLESPAGAGRFFPLARELVKRGHQVSIAALHADYASLERTRFTQDGVDVHYVGQMHVRKQGARKSYFPAHKLLGISLRAAWGLSQAALNTPTDLVHVAKPHPMNGLAGLLFHALKRKPFVLDCDDLETQNLHFSGAWQRRVIAFFENNLPRRADHVTTHNSTLAAFIENLGVPQSKISDLPNGVDIQRFVSVQPAHVQALRQTLYLEDQPVVAYVGSLSSPNHPVHLLLSAFQIVQQAYPHAILLVVGGGEDFDALLQMSHQLGIHGACRFTGRIPAAEIPVYYRLASVLVDPVEDNLVGRTRLPIKLFESWISRVPFVSADVGDRRRVLGDPPAGLLARPGDVEALAAEITRVLGSPELAASLVERGQQRAADYTWETLAVRMEVLYQRLLGGSASSRAESKT